MYIRIEINISLNHKYKFLCVRQIFKICFHFEFVTSMVTWII